MSRWRIMRLLMFLLLAGSAAVLFASSQRGAAQDAIFVTNTPAPITPTALSFATNTPSFVPPTAVPTAAPTQIPVVQPAGPVGQYALRLWTEADFNALVLEQVRAMRGDPDSIQALQLLQYEWQRRFPGAPRSAAVRAELIEAMLAAPRGSIDMRPVMRGVIEDVLNAVRPQFNATTRFESGGLRFDLTALNIDNADGLDAAVYVVAPSAQDPTLAQFEMVAVALSALDGTWRVPLATPEYPGAPLDDVTSVRVEYAGEVTGDVLAELAVSVDHGTLNRELRLLGWRGDRIVSLTAPGAELRFGELAPIVGQGEPIIAQEYQISSRRWDCIAARRVEWRYSLNYFRPTFDPAGYLPQPTLACTLATLDPVYTQPLARAIASVEALLDNAARDEAGFVRGQMALAMLYALDGQVGPAVTEMDTLRTSINGSAAGGAWVTAQADAFLTAAASNLPPLAWCGAMELARQSADDAICSVDEVLTRLWTETPPSRDLPLSDQIAALGGRVIEQATIREVGRLDRQVVRFELGLEHVWSFAPLQPGIYTAERVEPQGDGQFTPGATDLAPILNAFLATDDPGAALTVFETEIRSRQVTGAGAPVPGSLLYGRALALDLLGDRAGARAAYYEVWQREPASPWGRAAAAHLELR